jgi:hypothetical protein
MNATYCPVTGRLHTVEYEDKLCIGIHRKGVQVTLPLGVDEWQTLSMPSKVQVIFTDDSQIDTLIEGLNKLKNLKMMYNTPVPQVIL